MSDKKEQNQPRDPFSQYIQQQLKGHQTHPDAACWDEIGQRLSRRRNRLLLSRSLYIAGAAAIALLLLFNIPANKDIPSIQSGNIEELAINEVKTEKPIDNPAVAIAEVKPVHQSPTVATVPEEDTPEVFIELVCEFPPVTETETTTESESEAEKDKPIVNQKKKKTELPILPDKHISLPNKATHKRNWQVGAGLIAMGKNSLINEKPQNFYDQSPNDGSSGWIPPLPNYSEQLRPEECDDISYNIPLSFGITARKQLTEKLSVETGLVYTYLSTNLRRDSPTLIKGKLGLHYLGIPVNLIVDIWENPRWDIYASAGIMAEKGLRSVYTQKVYHTSRDEETTLKSSIPRIQWSASGAFGVSYRLHKDWSIYAEPRISYFFDNNQPISVRTDKPLTLGFGMGIRFDF